MKIWLIFAGLLLLLSNSDFAVTMVNSCRTLNQSGETYQLNTSVSGSPCFVFNASNIILDCVNSSNSITGQNPSISLLSTSSGASIRNCNLLHVDGASKFYITASNINGFELKNSIVGLMYSGVAGVSREVTLTGVSNAVFTNNIFHFGGSGNDGIGTPACYGDGIVLYNSSGVTIENNSFFGEDCSLLFATGLGRVLWMENSNNVVFRYNTANLSAGTDTTFNPAIYGISGSSNTISNNLLVPRNLGEVIMQLYLENGSTIFNQSLYGGILLNGSFISFNQNFQQLGYAAISRIEGGNQITGANNRLTGTIITSSENLSLTNTTFSELDLFGVRYSTFGNNVTGLYLENSSANTLEIEQSPLLAIVSLKNSTSNSISRFSTPTVTLTNSSTNTLSSYDSTTLTLISSNGNAFSGFNTNATKMTSASFTTSSGNTIQGKRANTLCDSSNPITSYQFLSSSQNNSFLNNLVNSSCGSRFANTYVFFMDNTSPGTRMERNILDFTKRIVFNNASSMILNANGYGQTLDGTLDIIGAVPAPFGDVYPAATLYYGVTGLQYPFNAATSGNQVINGEDSNPLTSVFIGGYLTYCGNETNTTAITWDAYDSGTSAHISFNISTVQNQSLSNRNYTEILTATGSWISYNLALEAGEKFTVGNIPQFLTSVITEPSCTATRCYAYTDGGGHPGVLLGSANVVNNRANFTPIAVANNTAYYVTCDNLSNNYVLRQALQSGYPVEGGRINWTASWISPVEDTGQQTNIIGITLTTAVSHNFTSTFTGVGNLSFSICIFPSNGVVESSFTDNASAVGHISQRVSRALSNYSSSGTSYAFFLASTSSGGGGNELPINTSSNITNVTSNSTIEAFCNSTVQLPPGTAYLPPLAKLPNIREISDLTQKIDNVMRQVVSGFPVVLFFIIVLFLVLIWNNQRTGPTAAVINYMVFIFLALLFFYYGNYLLNGSSKLPPITPQPPGAFTVIPNDGTTILSCNIPPPGIENKPPLISGLPDLRAFGNFAKWFDILMRTFIAGVSVALILVFLTLLMLYQNRVSKSNGGAVINVGGFFTLVVLLFYYGRYFFGG